MKHLVVISSHFREEEYVVIGDRLPEKKACNSCFLIG